MHNKSPIKPGRCAQKSVRNFRQNLTIYSLERIKQKESYMNKNFIIVPLLVIFSAAVFAADISLDSIIQNTRANQQKIHDLYAETTTKITSNLQMGASRGTGPQTMVQQGKMWSKGESKSKVEMLSPTHQTTITNGDKMAIINPETGQKMVQDLKKMREQGTVNSGQMSLEKLKEMFDLSVQSTVDSEQNKPIYIITGVPRKENKFLGKMVFYIDGAKWIATRVQMYDPKGKLLSQTDMEYQQIGGVYVPSKNFSNVTTPMGAMKVEMEYSNIKVNKGISDSEFKVD